MTAPVMVNAIGTCKTGTTASVIKVFSMRASLSNAAEMGRAQIPAKAADARVKRGGNSGTQSNKAAGKADDAVSKRAFISGYQAGTKHPGTRRASKLGETEGQLESLPVSKDEAKGFFKEGSEMTRTIAQNTFKIHGSDYVSSKCEGKDKKSCLTGPGGCQWKGGDSKCIDASSWQCAVRKKVLDCVATRYVAPSHVRASLDTLCGRTMLGQKKTKWVGCSSGVRTGEMCKDDKDCPVLVNTENEKLKRTKLPKCLTHQTVEGCSSALQVPCEEVGFQNFAGMVV